ncbi:hypothetical protein GQ600_11247 [Phytophthora cactorum]|nr:hypothetical protein GQ600_11247 [Phytophthora cactorum]
MDDDVRVRGVAEGRELVHEEAREKYFATVDNAPSHCADGVSLSNVCLEKLQPLDQGIIYCLKRDVLTRKMLHTLDEMDAGNNKPYKVGMLKGSSLTSKADLSFVLN